MNVELTHNVQRKNGSWCCKECGKTGDTITEVNLTQCPKGLGPSLKTLDTLEKMKKRGKVG